MDTLRERYCREHECTVRHFEAVLFWRSLHLPAWLCALPLGGRLGRYFAVDRDLLTGVAQARTMDDVREAVRDFFMEPANQRPLRRFGHVRVSTRKLKTFVRPYLPDMPRTPDADVAPDAKPPAAGLAC